MLRGACTGVQRAARHCDELPPATVGRDFNLRRQRGLTQCGRRIDVTSVNASSVAFERQPEHVRASVELSAAEPQPCCVRDVDVTWHWRVAYT